MKETSGKIRRLRLEQDSYRELHRKVLKRDGWRCQACGCMKHLQVHHIEFRSHSGGDVEENLITLCAECHATSHSRASSAVVEW